MTVRSLCGVVFALTACTADPPAAPVAPPVAPAPLPATAQVVPSAPLDDSSIYDLDLAMLDQTGKTIGLDVQRGHPVVIAMFYGSCSTACPVLIQELHDLDAAIAPARRPDVRFVLVSFDPARDGPDRLQQIARERGLTPDRWTLASVRPDDARMLAAVLGVRYRALDNGEFMHSSVITLLAADGHPIARLDGPRGDTAALAALVP